MARLLLAACLVAVPIAAQAQFDNSVYGFSPYFNDGETVTTQGNPVWNNQGNFNPAADSVRHPYQFAARAGDNGRHDVTPAACSPTLGCFTNAGALCSANPTLPCDVQTTPAGRCSAGNTACVWPNGAGRCATNTAIACLSNAYLTCLQTKAGGTWGANPNGTVCPAASGASSLCPSGGTCTMTSNLATCDCQGFDSSGLTGGWEGDRCGSDSNQSVCSDGDLQRNSTGLGGNLCVELCTSAVCTPAAGCGDNHTTSGALTGVKYPNGENFADTFTLQRAPGSGLVIAGPANQPGKEILDLSATYVAQWDMPGKGPFAAQGIRRMMGRAESWHSDQVFGSVAINAVTDNTGPTTFLCPAPANWQSGLPVKGACGPNADLPGGPPNQLAGAFCIKDTDCGCTTAPCGVNICDPSTFIYCQEGNISPVGWLYTRALTPGEQTGVCPPDCPNMYNWTTFEEEAFVNEFFFSGDPRIGLQLVFDNLEGPRAGKGDIIQVFPLVSVNHLFFGDLRCFIGGDPGRFEPGAVLNAPCTTTPGPCIGRCQGSALPCNPAAAVGANGCTGSDQCFFCGGTSNTAPNNGNTLLPLLGGVRGHDPAKGNANASPVGYNPLGFSSLNILGRIGHVNGVSTNLNVPLFAVFVHGPSLAQFRDNTCQGAAGVDKCDIGEVQAGTGVVGIGATPTTFTAGNPVPFDPTGPGYAVSRTIPASDGGNPQGTLLASGDWGVGPDGMGGCLGDNAPVANNACSQVLGVAGLPGSTGSDDPPIRFDFTTGAVCTTPSATCLHASRGDPFGKVVNVNAYTPPFTNQATLTLRDLAAITNTNGLDVISKNSLSQCPINIRTGQEECRDVDTDGDQWIDNIDDCNLASNRLQLDTGRIVNVPAGALVGTPDGVTNSCQCGDVNASGGVNSTDGLFINQASLNIGAFSVTASATVSKRNAAPFFLVGRCNVGGSGACTSTDALFVNRASLGLSAAGKDTFWRGLCSGETHPTNPE